MKTSLNHHTYKPGSYLLIFCLMAAVGCNHAENRINNRPGSGNKVQVMAIVARPQLLDNKIFTTGTLIANEEVELRPEISGRVTDVFFREGSRLKKGDLLIKLNDRELKAELKRKEIQEKLAAEEEARAKNLLNANGISQQEYDKIANSLQLIHAEKELSESQLAKTEIVAPFDGIVGLRHVSEGSYVSANVLVASMQDIDPIKLEFAIPEKYARQLKIGTAVLVSLGETEANRTGTVYAVEAKIDPGTRTIKARAKIPNSDGYLIPGSFARVEITLETYRDAIVIPAEGLITELSGEKVYLCKNGLAQLAAVKTGIRTEKEIQILEGIMAGDTVLISGLLLLADGRPVDIKNLHHQ
jgi:membrane fusion protein (multidrug efflux system)